MNDEYDYLYKEIQRHGERSFEENLTELALALCNFAFYFYICMERLREKTKQN